MDLWGGAAAAAAGSDDEQDSQSSHRGIKRPNYYRHAPHQTSKLEE